ncbi:hypothetical protein CF95_gp180 [Erwinia phage PhiEaH1]|jgi:hypothetical protein|uniref:Uncharacterized protein n=1 Tax=Erwinia phage PhiEaH1 TaxID=1401669 RepID=W8CZG1_9CAUD|nr:hypothetical protein CF95_gp180 [Erwinia phage PhiEaH1]AGX01902.1 hypothetical protein [Erwinia phage PhiEaH1]WBF04908.1 hypothetical protein [Erwinia phage vB_Ea277G]
MATRITPLPNMRGLYTLRMPWTTDNKVLYTCTALRTFRELIANGNDVFVTYYQPKGLQQSDYEADNAAGAILCVLQGDDGSIINVPDTYVVSYPDSSVPAVGHFVLSASIGPMRMDVNMDFLRSKVGEVISDTIGVVPEVFVDVLDSSTVMTREEYDAMEAARTAAIKNRSTTYALLLQEQARTTVLQNKVAELQSLLEQKQQNP